MKTSGVLLDVILIIIMVNYVRFDDGKCFAQMNIIVESLHLGETLLQTALVTHCYSVRLNYEILFCRVQISCSHS